MIKSNQLMLNTPVVSIGIISYNQGKYISKAIDSILNQNFDLKYEIIIIDDCSTDNTKNICEAYAANYPDIFVCIYNKVNKGVVYNFFKILMPICKGDFIALCAADDYWISSIKLKKQYELLLHNQKVSVVHTAYRKYFEAIDKYEDVTEWNSPLLTKFGTEAVKYVLKEDFTFFPVGSSIMFRNKEISKYLNIYSNIIDQKNIQGEGMILFTFFALNGYFYFMKDVSTVYLIRENSLSHIKKDKEKMRFNINYIFQKVYISNIVIHNNLISLRLALKLLFVLYYSLDTKCSENYFELLKRSRTNMQLKSINFIYYISLIITKIPVLRSLFVTVFKIKYQR